MTTPGFPNGFQVQNNRLALTDVIINGDLTVAGAIRPGTFTNRVVAIVDATAVADHLLTASQSGTTFLVNEISGGAQTITLPDAATGLNYKFIFQQVLAQNLTFTCSALLNAETMAGYTNQNSVVAAKAGVATTLVTTGTNVLIGDTVTLEATFNSRVGVCWNVYGLALTAATYT